MTKKSMNHKTEPTVTLPIHSSELHSLQLVISNGDPRRDARLKFEFQSQAPGRVQLWVVGLPQLVNADAFPRQVAPNAWELRLDAVAATQPIEVSNYTRENADEFLERFCKPQGGAPVELLILAVDGKFTVTVTEFYGCHR
jgi:adenine C2-methylase RlmN of 23S rRNA A2503 and tRNA A37